MRKTILILIFLPLRILSQDITGVWAGSMFNDTTRNYIPYEIVISNDQGKLTGFSRTTFKIDGIDNVGIKTIRVIRRNEKIFIEDINLVYDNYSIPPAKGVHQFSLLNYLAKDTAIMLRGTWRTNRTREYKAVTGSIQLQKVKHPEDSKLIAQLEKLNLINGFQTMPINSLPIVKSPIIVKSPTIIKHPSIVKKPPLIIANNNPPVVKISEPAAELRSRKIETIETVYFKSDSLILTLYDNGEVDGDTVTILMNGKVIWPRQGLTEKGINKTIRIPPDLDSVQLIMYAENLGSIPPNTGLLVVRDKGSDYEIRFSGDLQKNAAIVLKRRKK